VDDFFMATPVAVCGGSAPSFASRIAAAGDVFVPDLAVPGVALR
jgi:hypothetical protein